MITALKQLYEQRTKDPTARRKMYEQHAEDCIRAAELTVDPRRREQYLKLARQWTEAAEGHVPNCIGLRSSRFGIEASIQAAPSARFRAERRRNSSDFDV